MGFSSNRRDRLFKERNLNNLYARADRKVYLALGGKTPLLADQWALSFPAGVWYVFTQGDPKRLYDDGSGIPGIGTVYRLNHDQDVVSAELLQLDSVQLDPAGGQVYVDRWLNGYEPTAPTADVLAIHYSFELHSRTIDGTAYDVHLGLNPPDPWPAGGIPYSSYVRSVFAATGFTPYMPPARIHRYRRSVADIACEGLLQFTIKRTWLRFDCWRVHNCGDKVLVVYLEKPDGSKYGVQIPPFEVRSYRRRANGDWVRTWPGTQALECCQFFPYFKGDIPFFAGGPPQDWTSSVNSGVALIHERAQSANNLANPWVFLQWQQALRATLDPRVPYNARAVYGEFYADPTDLDALIGDCVHTWGRARLANATEEKIIEIKGTADLIAKLAEESIACTVAGQTLSVTNRSRWTRIYPLDCSVFQTAKNGDSGNRYWDISGASPSFTVTYPAYFCIQPSPDTSWGQRWTSQGWNAVAAPTIFDKIDTLRKKVLVELGWLATENQYETIPEAFHASAVTLTPFGLAMRVPTTVPVYEVAFQFDGTTEFEGSQDDSGLHPRLIPVGTSPDGTYNLDNYWAADVHILLAPPLSAGGVNSTWRELFPAVDIGGYGPAVWTAYVPAGGPWAYARTEYDWEVNRVFELDSDGDLFSMGADYWVNKWGGPGGEDASVRVSGKTNLTAQKVAVDLDFADTFPTDALRDAAPDDVWPDVHKPRRAGCTVIGYGATKGFDGQTMLHHDPADGASAHPYYRFSSYQFFQRLPKSAWMWDLLEYSVRAWRRTYRRVKGELDIPVGPGRKLADGCDAAGRGEEAAGWVQYLNFQGYSDLAALGLPVHDDGLNSGTPYYITIDDLSRWLGARGFAYNLDLIGYTVAYPLGEVIPKRRYGPAEETENLNLWSVPLAWYRSAQHRFVNLRLTGE